MIKQNLRHTLLCTVMLTAPLYSKLVQAHLEHTKDIKTQLQGLTSFTWRSDAVVEQDQAYLIPGALMGGEALPSTEGASFDEAQLIGTLNTEHHYYVDAKITAHRDEIELENLSLIVPRIPYLANSTFELGKLSSEVTPTANWHASQNTFSEAPLLGDLMFGRHFNDTGVRLSNILGPVRLGAEVFSGENWPASPGDGSASAFIQYDFDIAALQFNLDVWGMHSRAENRTDTRYSAGHSHGGNIIVSPSTEFFFSGDINTFGALLGTSAVFGRMIIRAEGEWISSQSEGLIFDSTQNSDLETQYDGVRFYLGLSYAKHQLSLQYEEVALQNELLSPVTSLFAQNANLVNNDFEPMKAMASWSYQINPDVRVRLESVSEKTVSEDTVNKVNVGIVWQRILF